MPVGGDGRSAGPAARGYVSWKDLPVDLNLDRSAFVSCSSIEKALRAANHATTFRTSAAGDTTLPCLFSREAGTAN